MTAEISISQRFPRDHYDLIVVGSGIAGLYAALLAAPHCKVLLATKEGLEESNTRYAQGGIAVALDERDSPELHLRDTIAAGDGLCDPERVGILTREAPERVLDLLGRGVQFDRGDENLAFTLEAAHTLPRVLHAGGDATGAGIESVLAAEVRRSRVDVQEHSLCTSLLTHEVDATRPARGALTHRQNVVHGVNLLLANGDSVSVEAQSVILASGGVGRLFSRTTNPPVATGDGLAIAYRAGAELTDLEFVQFHPTAIALEGDVEGATSFLISEAVRGEGAVLRDNQGHAFMGGYHPDRELAPRDVVARAIHGRMMETKAPHVWLDTTEIEGRRFEQRFPSIVRYCRQHGIDPVRQPIPVAPAAHYLMGGVRTDSWGRTSLPGLFACGEVACTGVHGANRLASNSLLEGLVFAHRAVRCLLDERESSQDWRLASHSNAVPLTSSPVLRDAACWAEREELAEKMWRHVGLVRSRESLLQAVQQLTVQVGSPSQRRVGRAAAENANLTLLGSLLAQAALWRQESRGAHFRSDYPRHDPQWQGHIVLSRGDAAFLPLTARTLPSTSPLSVH